MAHETPEQLFRKLQAAERRERDLAHENARLRRLLQQQRRAA